MPLTRDVTPGRRPRAALGAALAAVCISSAAVALTGCERGTPPPESLVKLLRKVETGTFDKLDIRGEFDRSAGLVHFRFQFLHTGDGQAAGYIVDPVDRTPIAVMIGDSTAVYDQQNDALVIVRGTRPMLVIAQGSGDVTLNFSPDPKPTDPAAPPAVVSIDLPAIVEAHGEKREVARASENLFELSGRAGPSRIAVLLQPGQAVTPIERFTHELTGGQPAKLVLERMLTNQEVSQRIRPLPSTETLSKHFHIIEAVINADAPLAEKNKALDNLFRRAAATLAIRQTLREPLRRADAVRAWGAIDWIGIEKSDPIVSEKLRRLLLLPGPAEPLER